MRRSMLVVCALVAGTTLSCDKIKQAIDKRRNRTRTPASQTATRDTTKKPAPAATPAPATPAAGTKPKPAPAVTQPERPAPTTPSSPPPQAPRTLMHDEPFNSADTGTIAPGMSQQEVVAVWGPAFAVRHAGAFTYLHYPNGCEYSCGTDDVVILQNDQVVDAIVRWRGHGYSGQSTSPPGKTPEPTLP
jgi:hypothetical protein